MKKRRHLIVLSDAQLLTIIEALTMEMEDWGAFGESHPRAARAISSLKRQRCEGISPSEKTWAMEEIVRINRRSDRVTNQEGRS